MTLAQQIANRIKVKLNLMTNQINSLSSGTGNVPVGATLEYAGSVLPTGFLFCDGAAVSRTNYANLFTALGISHGQGDGVNTFNLPDYRGVFLRGVDGGSGRDPDASSRTALQAGGNAGDAVGTYQVDAIIEHSHSTQRYGSDVSSNIISSVNTTNGGNGSVFMTDGAALGANSLVITRPLSLSGHPIPIALETRVKNVSVNRIIKF